MSARWEKIMADLLVVGDRMVVPASGEVETVGRIGARRDSAVKHPPVFRVYFMGGGSTALYISDLVSVAREASHGAVPSARPLS